MTFNIFKFINTLTTLDIKYTTALFLMCHYYITLSYARPFTFFIIFEKNAFFNVLYSYFSRSLHLWYNALHQGYTTDAPVYRRRQVEYIIISKTHSCFGSIGPAWFNTSRHEEVGTRWRHELI